MEKDESKQNELRAVRNLLILLLIKSGATAEEIGKALGVTGRQVRRMVPLKGITKPEGK